MTAIHQQCFVLRDSLPADARKLLKSLLKRQASNVDVAIFGSRLPVNLIWPTLSCLHHWDAPTDLLQECIRCFWKIEEYHRAIFSSDAFTLESAREMFKQARFPSPLGFTQPIQVWRGTAGRTQEEACKGLCWTLDRDVACWFATLHGKGKGGTPIVVTAHVQPDQILFSDDERDGTYEQEVILDRIDSAEVDGAEPEWRVRAKHFAEWRNARQRGEPLA